MRGEKTYTGGYEDVEKIHELLEKKNKVSWQVCG